MEMMSKECSMELAWGNYEADNPVLTKACIISCLTVESMPSNSWGWVEIIFGHKLAYPAMGLEWKEGRIKQQIAFNYQLLLSQIHGAQ